MSKQEIEILREICLVGAAIFIITVLTAKCFGSETVEKIDDYTAKIEISNIVDENNIKTTITQEKNFTLTELLQAKSAAETALKTWQDKIAETNSNIELQTKQIEMWDRLIVLAKEQGIIEKLEKTVLEETVPEAITEVKDLAIVENK